MCTNAAIFEYEEKISTFERTKEGEGALSSQPPKATRAFSNNHPNKSTILKEDEWCHYGGLPSPMAYMD
jgi:hypothetical protein